MWRFTRYVWAAVVVAAACAGPAAAQEITASPFTTADGLPSDQVRAVAQSADGWLWVGTTRGLRQFFDSQFRADNLPDRISEDGINALLATDDGTLWVGADSGLYRRNPDGSWDTQVEKEAGLEVGRIRALHMARDGAVWVGGLDSLARWSGGTWETMTIEGLPPAVSALGEDAQGRLWVAALGPEGGVIQILEGHDRIEVIDSGDGLPARAEITALLRDATGDMWAATDAGLVAFSGFSVDRILTEADGLANDSARTVIEHLEGGLWVGTAGGLNRLEDGVVTSSLTSEVARARESVNALAYDLEGNLWVGTSAGVSRLPLGTWSTVSHPLLGFTEIEAVLPGADGAGYAVTAAGVVHRTSTGEWTLLDAGMPGQAVYALVRAPDGAIWAGTNAGLAKLADGCFEADPRVPNDLRAQAVLIDRKGTLWVGTNEGLYRVSGEETTLFSKASGELGQNSVLGLWETGTGDIWVATLNGGASRYREGAWAIVNRGNTGYGLVDDVVVDGLEDSAGRLWFATTTGMSRLQAGADPYDPAAWRTFQVPELAGEQVNALFEDRTRPGNIWVGTDGGLNLISGDRPPSAFTRDDGLSHKWVNALGQAPDGTVWIGTASGLTTHRDAQQAPLIELGPLLVDNEVCDAACLAEGVPYRSETATFQYAASDLGDLAGIEYLVSIRAGEIVSQVQTRNRSIVESLEPGTEYAFSVQAIDRDFNASSTAGPITLSVESPTFWERLREAPYFPYLLVAVILGGSGLAATGTYKGYQWWLRRQFFRYSLDLAVSLTSAEAAPGLHVSVEGVVRWPRRLNKILRRLQVPPALLRGLTRKPEPLKMEVIHRPDYGRIERLEADLREDGREAPGTVQDLQTLGTLLYRALFPDPMPETLRRLDLGHPTRSARLCLRQEEAPRLKAIPWELMYDPEQPGYLTIDSQVTLVRDLADETDTDDLAVASPLRVLVVLANPDGEGLVKLRRQEDEYAAIEEALTPLIESDMVDLQSLRNARWDEFEAAVREEGFDVIHFTGHGGIWRNQDLRVLYFESERGTPVRVPQKPLVDLFQSASTAEERRPKLVVLNACRSAEQDVIEGTLGLAEALVQVGRLPAAIGMGYEISEDAAVVFCRAFYRTLVAHGQVDHAVMVGRRALASQLGRGRLHWGAPRLYSRVRGGVIFDLVKTRSETDEPA